MKLKLFQLPTEHQEQVAFVEWFRLSYPDVVIFANPNGGHRTKASAGKIRAEGGLPGVPDLFVPAWRLWIEMKRRKGGQLSVHQKNMIEYLTKNGYDVIIAHGRDEAIDDVLSWVRSNNKC